MNGVSLTTNAAKDTILCVVNNFSDEIQKTVRDQLSRVCFGERKVLSGNPIYSYKRTVKEFVKRYKTKSPDIQTGMLGELLCHVLLLTYCPHLRAASPYFNSEESSIKKGFDAILFSSVDEAAWFTEVKSGEVGKMTPPQKMKALVDLAKLDLVKRIDENDSTTWYSAINNIEIALKDGERAKDILLSVLSNLASGDDPSKVKAKEHCAVLVPVLFEDVANQVPFLEFETKSAKIQGQKHFSQCLVFGIQKSTIKRLEEFLLMEAA